MRVCAAWKIDCLFEQLDEDSSGSLDEQKLFKLMQVAAEQPFPKPHGARMRRTHVCEFALWDCHYLPLVRTFRAAPSSTSTSRASMGLVHHTHRPNHTRTHRPPHTHTHAHMHTCTHKQTHTGTRTQARINEHTHSNTHTYPSTRTSSG